MGKGGDDLWYSTMRSSPLPILRAQPQASALNNHFQPLAPLSRHHRTATPALLKATLHQLTTLTKPLVLRHVLQVVKQIAGSGLLARILDPYLRQALIWGELTRCTAQILALNLGVHSVCRQRVGPQCCKEKVGSLG